MWTDADRETSFARISSMLLMLPAAEAAPWGQHLRLSVAGKGFGYIWNDHHGNGRLALSCKAAPDEQRALVQANPASYFVPEYDGRNGWIGVHLDPEHRPDWTEITQLLEQAWRLAAPKSLQRQLESVRSADG